MKNLDVNSIKNQSIKGQFVQREVLANVNTLVEFILSSEGRNKPFEYEDIENLYRYADYNGHFASMYSPTEEEREIILNTLKEFLEEEENKEERDEEKISRIEKEIEEIEEMETEPQDIFEWWIVTNWLGEKLKEKGYPVVSDGSNTYWGRTTTGQAILLDGVISDICKDLEILEGQKSEWK